MGASSAWMLLGVFLLSSGVHFAAARGGDAVLDRRLLAIPILKLATNSTHVNQTAMMQAALIYFKAVGDFDDVNDHDAPSDDEKHYCTRRKFPNGCVKKRKFDQFLGGKWIPGSEAIADPRFTDGHFFPDGPVLIEFTRYILSRPEGAVPYQARIIMVGEDGVWPGGKDFGYHAEGGVWGPMNKTREKFWPPKNLRGCQTLAPDKCAWKGEEDVDPIWTHFMMAAKVYFRGTKNWNETDLEIGALHPERAEGADEKEEECSRKKFPYGCITKDKFDSFLHRKYIPGFDLEALKDVPVVMKESHMYRSGTLLQRLHDLTVYLLTRPLETVPLEARLRMVGNVSWIGGSVWDTDRYKWVPPSFMTMCTEEDGEDCEPWVEELNVVPMRYVGGLKIYLQIGTRTWHEEADSEFSEFRECHVTRQQTFIYGCVTTSKISEFLEGKWIPGLEAIEDDERFALPGHFYNPANQTHLPAVLDFVRFILSRPESAVPSTVRDILNGPNNTWPGGKPLTADERQRFFPSEEMRGCVNGTGCRPWAETDITAISAFDEAINKGVMKYNDILHMEQTHNKDIPWYTLLAENEQRAEKEEERLTESEPEIVFQEGEARRFGTGPKAVAELTQLRGKFLALEFVEQRCPSQAEKFAVDHESTFRLEGYVAMQSVPEVHRVGGRSLLKAKKNKGTWAEH
eukprot:CAMPEP_0118950780 /NCGR_PEP_ID=MMETSP1169-20130426/51995_1 /TAXON_ID=36882 /ORGANISM="Pyramimonas obovata, Strain CCMP722" /LENGTH=684 /DNA_ID=CAMNT_0006897693 /DNA_START=114 /DNA_END=2165 /DNA_ORIENTATION=+